MACDIAIITIKEEELAAVLEELRLEESTDHNLRRYYRLGKVRTRPGQQVSVAITRCPTQGNGVSQDVAHDVLAEMAPACLLVVGIAGTGPSEDLSLGDVVLGLPVLDFTVSAALEGGAREFAVGQQPLHPVIENFLSMRASWELDLGEWFKRPGPCPATSASDEDLYGPADWQDKVRRCLVARASRSSGRIVATAAAMGSSDILVKDHELLKTWLAVARHIRAIEMESAGIYIAARGREPYRKQHPVVSIRAISDIVGRRRDPEWTRFACASGGGGAFWRFESGRLVPDLIQRSQSSAPRRPPDKAAPTLPGVELVSTEPVISAGGASITRISPDGRAWVMSASGLHTINLAAPEMGAAAVRGVAGVQDAVDIALRPDRATDMAITREQDIAVLEATSVGYSIAWRTANEKRCSRLVWAPNGLVLAGCGQDVLCIVDAYDGKVISEARGHRGRVTAAAWTGGGRVIATAGADGAVVLWRPAGTRQQDRYALQPFEKADHGGAVRQLEWSADAVYLAVTVGPTIEILSVGGRDLKRAARLEGHRSDVTHVAWAPWAGPSSSARMLASVDERNECTFWSLGDSPKRLGVVAVADTTWRVAAFTFEPEATRLHIGLDNRETGDVLVRTLVVDQRDLEAAAPIQTTYSNAKIVFVGETGAGKTVLTRVLAGFPFEPAASSHGRKVLRLERESRQDARGNEVQETLMWDLAGQTHYRITHQLHLQDAACALIVIDGRAAGEVAKSIRYWSSAVESAARLAKRAIPKALVGAREEMGRVRLTADELARIARQAGLKWHVWTSAGTGTGVEELRRRIKETIDWASLPKAASTEVISEVRDFIAAEGLTSVLATENDLFTAFARRRELRDGSAITREEFSAFLTLMAHQSVVRRLSFGGLVLLRPEMIDGYSAAMVKAAADGGMGSASEAALLRGEIPLGKGERAEDPGADALLLRATLEELLGCEVAFRDDGAEGSVVVFPGELVEGVEPDVAAVANVRFAFRGPVMSIFAMLIVRLAGSGVCELANRGGAVAVLRTRGGESYIRCVDQESGNGVLELAFAEAVPDEVRRSLDDYVRAHLERTALVGTVVRTWLLICRKCGVGFTEAQVEGRRKRKRGEIQCSVCDTETVLSESGGETAARVDTMDAAADLTRQRSVSVVSLAGELMLACEGHETLFLLAVSENMARYAEELAIAYSSMQRLGVYGPSGALLLAGYDLRLMMKFAAEVLSGYVEDLESVKEGGGVAKPHSLGVHRASRSRGEEAAAIAKTLELMEGAAESELRASPEVQTAITKQSSANGYPENGLVWLENGEAGAHGRFRLQRRGVSG